MLSIAHTLISLPLAIYLHNPFLIFLAAILVHVLADTFLHWNIFFKPNGRYPFEAAMLDVLVGLGLAYFLTGPAFFTISVWAAIIGGNAPDVTHAAWHLVGPKRQQKYFRWLTPLFTWHEKLQLETISPALGLISQVALGLLAIAIAS